MMKDYRWVVDKLEAILEANEKIKTENLPVAEAYDEMFSNFMESLGHDLGDTLASYEVFHETVAEKEKEANKYLN